MSTALLSRLRAGVSARQCRHNCRVPAAELTERSDAIRAGNFSKRKDLAALVIVFTFGALLNAFGMVSPVYAFENWLAKLLGINRELPILAFVFGLFLVLEPLLLIGLAAWLTRVWGGSRRPIVAVAVRYSYVLAPLGFGIWLAHYGFHFLTGLYTIVPVTQAAVAELVGPCWDSRIGVRRG
jgi:ABC-type amino acid transport system permease subunit